MCLTIQHSYIQAVQYNNTYCRIVQCSEQRMYPDIRWSYFPAKASLIRPALQETTMLSWSATIAAISH